MHRCLRARVASPNHKKVIVRIAQCCLSRAGAIVHAGSEKLVLVGKIQSAVLHPCRTDGRACDDFCAVGQVANSLAWQELAANAFAQQQDLRPEVTSLFASSRGKVRSADSVRKPKVVLNLGA